MTKKEQAELEAAKRQAALRWTEKVLPDILVPIGEDHTQGFKYNAWEGGWRVTETWSESLRHGSGPYAERKRTIASQYGIPLYSSRLLALKAARHELEQIYAEKLRALDIEIEKEAKQ